MVLADHAGVAPAALSLEGIPLRGGTESAAVVLVTARGQDRAGRARSVRAVAKQLRGRALRERAVYESVLPRASRRVAPKLLGATLGEGGSAWLFLEAIRKAEAWPWRHMAAGDALLRRLAEWHRSAAARGGGNLPDWNYGAELQESALATCGLLAACRHDPDLAPLSRAARQVERLALALPRLRAALLAEQPFGTRLIHGDVHSGNAMLARRGKGAEPVLIDWGRARPGSPLEDVSAWLQSLRFWEPEVERRHDSLLKIYLSGLGQPQLLTPEIRGAYWMAAACNAFSGAVLHHVSVAADRRQAAGTRAQAFGAARNWVRVLRRAHAWAC